MIFIVFQIENVFLGSYRKIDSKVYVYFLKKLFAKQCNPIVLIMIAY